MYATYRFHFFKYKYINLSFSLQTSSLSQNILLSQIHRKDISFSVTTHFHCFCAWYQSLPVNIQEEQEGRKTDRCLRLKEKKKRRKRKNPYTKDSSLIPRTHVPAFEHALSNPDVTPRAPAQNTPTDNSRSDHSSKVYRKGRSEAWEQFKKRQHQPLRSLTALPAAQMCLSWNQFNADLHGSTCKYTKIALTICSTRDLDCIWPSGKARLASSSTCCLQRCSAPRATPPAKQPPRRTLHSVCLETHSPPSCRGADGWCRAGSRLRSSQ